MLSGLGSISAAAPARGDGDDPQDAGCPRSSTAYVCVTFADPGVHAPVQLRPSAAFNGTSACACDVRAGVGQYRTRAANGTTQNLDSFNGLSMAALIALASGGTVNATAVTFTQTSLISSSSVYQSVLDNAHGKNQLERSSFGDGLAPAVFFSQNASPTVSYIRPWLAGNNHDVNDADSFETASDFVHVVVHTTGEVLYPTVSVRPGEVKANQTVTFTADLGDAPADGDYSYAWSFGDSSSTTGAIEGKRVITYKYKKAGSFVPVVTVTDSKYTSYGQSSLSGPHVKVGDQTRPDPRTTSSGAGTGPSTNPSDGPVDGTGTKVRGAPSGAPGNGTNGTAGPGSGSPAPAGGSAASGTGTAAGTGRPRPPAPGGEFVRGLALNAPDQAAAQSSTAAGEDSAPAARVRGRDRLDLRWLLWLVPIGLVALGVFAERRRPRRRSSHS